MLNPADLSFIAEADEDAIDLLQALPDVRKEVAPRRTDDDLGIRSLLEHPEELATPGGATKRAEAA